MRSSIRSLRLLLLFTVSLSLLSLHPVWAENPACDDKPDDCSCIPASERACHCTSGTSGGSIRFTESITGYVKGDSHRSALLNFSHKEPSITMHTVQGLNYLTPAGAFLNGTAGDFTAEEPVQITMATGDLSGGLIFEVADGASVGYPVRSIFKNHYQINLLDANKEPIVDAVPTYVERVDADDMRLLFDFATGDVVEMIDTTGQSFDFSDVKVLRSSGVLRQIRTAYELVDLVTIDPDHEFEIRLYAPDQYGDLDPATGLYRLNADAAPFKVLNIKNPNYDSQDISETYITRTWGGRVKQWQFKYFGNNYYWDVKVGEITASGFQLLEQQEVAEVQQSDAPIRNVYKIVRDSNSNVLSHEITRYQEFPRPIGSQKIEKIQDPDKANLVQSMQYYTSGHRAGELQYKSEPDGDWSAYDYDAQDREILQLQAWMDSQWDAEQKLSEQAASHRAIYSSYAAVDPRDDLSLKSEQPRQQITKIKGLTAEITWSAYFRDADGLYFERSERATRPNANYGDSHNLWSEKVYYAPIARGESPLRAGRLKQERQEDGSLRLYDYTTAANGQFLVTETRVHESAPNGTAGQSTRLIMAYDARALLVAEYFQIFDGSDYQAAYHSSYRYDTDRNRIETKRWDGLAEGRIVQSASYQLGKAVETTDASGRTVQTSYDVLDRKLFEVIVGSAASGVDDILRLYQYSSSASGCGCSASEVLIQTADGSLSLSEINETDRVKRPSRRVDVNGLETRFDYTDGGRVTTESLPNGQIRITTRYRDGRLKSITGSGVIPEYYSYGIDANGARWTRVSTGSVDSPRYRITRTDLAGRLLAERTPAFGGATQQTNYSYDGFGRLVSSQATGQAATLYQYNPQGQLTRSGMDVDGDGQLTLASSDRITDSERRYQLIAGDWFEQSSSRVYPTAGSDAAITVSTSERRLSGFSGQLTAQTRHIDSYGRTRIHSTELDRVNKTTTQLTSDSSSSLTARRVHSNGYLLSASSLTIAEPTVYRYDGLGRLIETQQPHHSQPSIQSYHPGTRQLAIQTDAAGHSTQYSYYPQGVLGAGQIAQITNALGQSSYRAYDALGRQIQIWGATEYPQAYTYNAFGELSALTTWRNPSDDFASPQWPSSPGPGATTSWSYDAATGLLTAKTYADGKGTQYQYDASNRLVSRSWARDDGLKTQYRYAPATGELLAVDYSSPDTADIRYSYDRLGRQTSVEDATGLRSFSYSSQQLHLLQETLDADFYQGHQVQRSVDALGRNLGYQILDAQGTPLPVAASYSYSNTGRLQSITSGSESFTYQYQSESNLLEKITAPHHSVIYSYVPNRDMISRIHNQRQDGSSLSAYDYSYDALGRRTQRLQSGTALSASSLDRFSYNARSEVIASDNDLNQALNASYAYDSIGNRLTATGLNNISYSSNALNQYTSITVDEDSQSPSYDFDGNLISDTQGWTYQWNAENRLKSASNGQQTLYFTYDYQGRLVKKEDGSQIEVYAYDGWNRIASFEQTSTLTLQSSYLWGLDLSGSLQGAGGVGGLLKEGDLYPAYDANGNIMQKLDATGEVVMSVAYDAFGQLTSGQLVGDYGFSSKPRIPGINWYYYGFRYYDPVMGRWPSRDPIGIRGGLNLYAIVRNNVVCWIDYLGLSDPDLIFHFKTYLTWWVEEYELRIDVGIPPTNQWVLISSKTIFSSGDTPFSTDCGSGYSYVSDSLDVTKDETKLIHTDPAGPITVKYTYEREAEWAYVCEKDCDS